MLRQDVSRYTDLSKIEELYDATVTHCKQVTGKGVVFVVGKTGSGKSTTINCLIDVPLKKVTDPKTAEVQIVADIKHSKHAPKFAVIGHAGSQTTFPSLFAPKWTNNLYYCDLAGFGDTRGDVFDANAYLSAHIVAQMAAEIKGIICVIEYSNLRALRGLPFVELAKLMKQIFLAGSFSRYFRDCIKFVVTKVPNEISKENILASIKKIGDLITAEEAGLNSIHQEILKRPENLLIIRAEDLVNSPQKIRDEINTFFKTPRANILHHHLSFLKNLSIESLEKIIVKASRELQQLLVSLEEKMKRVMECEQAVKQLDSIVKEEEVAKDKLLNIIEYKIKTFDTEHQLKEQSIQSCGEKIEKFQDAMRNKIFEYRKLMDQRISQEIKDYRENVNTGYQQQLALIDHFIEQMKHDCSAYKVSNPEAADTEPAIQHYLTSIKSYEDKKQAMIGDHMHTMEQEIKKIVQQINDEIIAMEKNEHLNVQEQIDLLTTQISELKASKIELEHAKENYLKQSQVELAAQVNKIDALRANLDRNRENLELIRADFKIIEKNCHAREHDFEILRNLDARFPFNYKELKDFILTYQRYRAAKLEMEGVQEQKSTAKKNVHNESLVSGKFSIFSAKFSPAALSLPHHLSMSGPSG